MALFTTLQKKKKNVLEVKSSLAPNIYSNVFFTCQLLFYQSHVLIKNHDNTNEINCSKIFLVCHNNDFKIDLIVLKLFSYKLNAYICGTK